MNLRIPTTAAAQPAGLEYRYFDSAGHRPAHVPCLFLFGTKDDNRKEIPLLRTTMAEYAEFADIEGAAHGDAIVSPAFREAVLRFFSKHTVAPGTGA